MASLDTRNADAVTISTDTITVNDASNWIQIGIVILGGTKEQGLLTLNVGSGGALGHFRLTRADNVGGNHVDWIVDTDFNTATDEMIDCVVPGNSPPNISTLAASKNGHIKLDRCLAIGEIGIWAKKATTDTTLQVTGCFSVAK